jgi:hypothetical protein
MPLFDNKKARRLRDRPSVLFPADPAGALVDLLRRYDPAMSSSPDRLALSNGVRLYGPIEVTPDLERKAGLPPGMTTAYYTVVAYGAEAKGRPEKAMWQDAERLVRGLGARLGATVHDKQPPAEQKLEVTVFSGRQLPAEQVIGVLQPFVDTGKLYVDSSPDEPDRYNITTEQRPPFFVMYWAPSLALSTLKQPPLALAGRFDSAPCSWGLYGFDRVEDTPRDVVLKVGEAALALARAAGGIVIDGYGFPVDRPEELLPVATTTWV